MAIDLAQFHDAFFDESFEALDSMEAALLKRSEERRVAWHVASPERRRAPVGRRRDARLR